MSIFPPGYTAPPQPSPEQAWEALYSPTLSKETAELVYRWWHDSIRQDFRPAIDHLKDLADKSIEWRLICAKKAEPST